MQINVFSSIQDIDIESWKHFIKKRYFLSYHYLECLEKSCTDIEYRYTVLYDDSHTIVGVAYFQIADFKGKSLYGYLPETNIVLNKLLKFGLDRIDTKLLTLGNIIFTCENGNRFDESISNEEKISCLDQMITKTIDSMPKKPLGIMVSEELTTHFKEDYKKLGYHIFRVEDKMEYSIKNIETLELYKNNLHSKYRVRMNKVYQLNHETETIDINVSNFNQYKESIEQLFKQVTSNSKFKLINIDAHYFYSFLENCNEKFKIIGFVHNGKLVGFISYFILEYVVEVHYIGLDYQYNESHKTYNYMLYKMLELGLSERKKVICFGRTAQEIKSTLGAYPINVYGYLKIRNTFLNQLAPMFLSRLVPKAWVQRNPFKH